METLTWDRTLDGKLDLDLCLECDHAKALGDGFCSSECRDFFWLSVCKPSIPKVKQAKRQAKRRRSQRVRRPGNGPLCRRVRDCVAGLPPGKVFNSRTIVEETRLNQHTVIYTLEAMKAEGLVRQPMRRWWERVA